MRPKPWLRLAFLIAALAAPAAAEPAIAGNGSEAEQEARESLLEEDDPLFDDDDDLVSDSASRDPWEPINRGVFAFNRGLDTVLLDPVTRTYQFVVPEPGRRAFERLFLNLDTPVILVNQVLQLRPVDAAGTLARFVINTTAGCAGLFDPAGEGAGIPRTKADFGQTLGRYGTPSGPYLILPAFGPSTARDAFGDLVDVMTDPLTYVTGPFSFRWWTLALGGSEGLVVLESHADDLRQLEEGSLDFYSALRSAYLQDRDAQIRAVRGGSRHAH